MKNIETVKQELMEFVEARKLATPGPWHQNGTYGEHIYQTAHITRDVWHIAEFKYDSRVDAAFTVLAANTSARHAEMLIRAIEVIEKINSCKVGLCVNCRAVLARFLDSLSTSEGVG